MLFTRYDRGWEQEQERLAEQRAASGDPWSSEFELWRWGAER